MSIDTGFDKRGMFGFWANCLAARRKDPSSTESKEADRERDVSRVALPAIRQERRDRSPDLRLHVDVFVNRGDDREPRSARAEREVAVERYEDPTPRFDRESLTAPYGTTLIKSFCKQGDIGEAIEVMKALGKKELLNNIHVNSFLKEADKKHFVAKDLVDLNDLISRFNIPVLCDNVRKWIGIHLYLNVSMNESMSSYFRMKRVNHSRNMSEIFTELQKKDKDSYHNKTHTLQVVVRSAADVCFKAWLQKASSALIENNVIIDSYLAIRRGNLGKAKAILRDVYNEIYKENPERAKLLLRVMLSGTINNFLVSWGEPFTSHLNQLLKSDVLSPLPEGDL